MKTEKIIHHTSRYGIDSDGGGLRHRQIIEKIKCFLKTHNDYSTYHGGTPKKITEELTKNFFRLVSFSITHPITTYRIATTKFGDSSLIQLFLCARSYYFWKRKIKENKPALLICEDVFYGTGIILAHHEAKIPIISLPHNLDSIAHLGEDIPLALRLKNFQFELEFLKKCSGIFTINRVETLFLKNLGVNCETLDYFPPRDRQDELLKIRKEREKNPATGKFLISGSYHNPPTRRGIKALEELLKDEAIQSEIVITGRGDHHSNFKSQGFLPHDAYADLCTKIKGMLVHQESGCGILTKIIDSLIMGVPVIASEIAARGWEGIEGVYIYRDSKELCELLSRPLPNPPLPLDSKNSPQVKKLNKKISQFL
jgi:glycosyltransferase involved in cell wall biosynthesis